ncbi:putative HTH-type transcriptional regulator YegW [Pseudovibrio sp. W64]|uniref:GntR family transcriptional regulator n=1 Tax=Pseudovibrio sp. W64 TaxID=1735583 RepID=UPI0007AE9F0F|nr:GntR family transcriptional regulator [Pseudovibrio sp. W64]KZK79012.1 putative HTH-type transcriptional regulator YegW [Pseudovibrio sp. W64]
MDNLYQFLKDRLAENDPSPLYQRLVTAIKEAIQQEVLSSETFLPSERNLAQNLGVSRKTVRHALETLREENVIGSHQGVGSYISRDISYTINNEAGFSEIVTRTGATPSTHWLSKQAIEAPEAIADELGVAAGTPILQFKRLRSIDGHPVSLEDSYINCPQIEDPEAVGDSLYSFFKEQGIVKGKHHSAISACMPDEELRQLLNCSEMTPLLLVRQKVDYPDSKQILEYSINYCLSDAYEFTFEH